jgi:hypothetical protein
LSDTVAVTEFWRVGRRADPLRVLAEYQGAGRFDDPERLIAVLYGAPTLRTCLLEFLLPWKAAPGADAVLAAIPEATDEAEAADAARDDAIATESRRVPPMLYDRIAVQVRAAPTLALLDLHSVSVRDRLAREPAVAHELQRASACPPRPGTRTALAMPSNRRDKSDAMTFEDLYAAILSVKDASEAQFGRLDAHLSARFSAIDARFDRVDARFDRMDVRFGRLETRFEAVEDGLAAVRTDIGVLQSGLDAVRTDIGGLQGGLDAVRSDIAGVQDRAL